MKQSTNGPVLLYHDDGAGPFVTGCFERRLIEFGHHVQRVDASDVLAGSLSEEAVAFVLPGGADRPYLRKLGDAGAREIRRFVMAGGRFFGSCAGGYYAARRITFDAPGFAVREPRPLDFFPGTAAGPVPGLAPPFRDHPSAASVVDVTGDFGTACSLYWGGFSLKTDGPDDCSIARYDMNGQSAAAACDVGDGRAVICGFHPEVTAKDLATLDGASAQLVEQLERAEATRNNCFAAIWQELFKATDETAADRLDPSPVEG